jgi:hypothetical protein
MHSNVQLSETLIHSNFKTSQYLNFRCCFSRRKSLNYKNRSLTSTFTIIERTSNFFNFKGFKLKYYKILLYSNLFFFYNIYNIKTPAAFIKKHNYTNFILDIESFPIMHKLLSESDIYMDFNVLIPFFITKDLPMIKSCITVRKFLKKKKPKNKIKYKYSIRYVYVPHTQRILVSMRWFGMMVKLRNTSLINSFINNTLNIMDENQSFIIKLRNQIYLGLAAEQD